MISGNAQRFLDTGIAIKIGPIGIEGPGQTFAEFSGIQKVTADYTQRLGENGLEPLGATAREYIRSHWATWVGAPFDAVYNPNFSPDLFTLRGGIQNYTGVPSIEETWPGYPGANDGVIAQSDWDSGFLGMGPAATLQTAPSNSAPTPGTNTPSGGTVNIDTGSGGTSGVPDNSDMVAQIGTITPAGGSSGASSGGGSTQQTTTTNSSGGAWSDNKAVLIGAGVLLAALVLFKR